MIDSSLLTRRVAVRTAPELLDMLLLRGEHLRSGEIRGAWVFRGQADARWKLLPTVLRGPVLLRNVRAEPSWVEVDPMSMDSHRFIEHEISTLAHFFQRADAAGLALPESSQKLRRALEDSDLMGL